MFNMALSYVDMKFDKGCCFAKGRLTAFTQLVDLLLVRNEFV